MANKKARSFSFNVNIHPDFDRNDEKMMEDFCTGVSHDIRDRIGDYLDEQDALANHEATQKYIKRLLHDPNFIDEVIRGKR